MSNILAERDDLQVRISQNPSRTSAHPIELCNLMLDKFNKSQNGVNPDDIRTLRLNLKNLVDNGDIKSIHPEFLQNFFEFTIRNQTNADIESIELFLSIISIGQVESFKNLDYLKKICESLHSYCLTSIFDNNSPNTTYNIIGIVNPLFAIIQSRDDLPEFILAPLCSTLIRLYFCDKSSIILQRSLMVLICLIFRRLRPNQSAILNEVLQEGKSKYSEKQNISVIGSNNEKINILPLTFLLLNLIQSVEQPPLEYGMSQQLTKLIIAALMDKLNPKNKIFERFSQDVASLIYHPNFPVCELVSRCLLIGCMNAIDMKEQYIPIGLKVISNIITGISKWNMMRTQATLLAFPAEIARKIIQCEESKIGDEEMISIIKDSKFPSNPFQKVVAEIILLNYIKQSEIQSYVCNTTAFDYVLSYLQANSTSEMEMNNIIFWMKGNLPENPVFTWPIEYAYMMSACLFASNQISTSLANLINYISNFRKQTAIKIRLTIIKMISNVIAIDPSFLSLQSVISRIQESINDSSSSVRECAIDILSKSLTSNESINSKYIDCIIQSINDKSPAVVSTTLSVLDKISINNLAGKSSLIASLLAAKIDHHSAIVKKHAKNLLKALLEKFPIDTFSSIVSKVDDAKIFKFLEKTDIIDKIASEIINGCEFNTDNANAIKFICGKYPNLALKYKYTNRLLTLHNEIDDNNILPILSDCICDMIIVDEFVDTKLLKETFKKSVALMQKSSNIDVLFSESKLVCVLEQNQMKDSKITENMLSKLSAFIKNDPSKISKRSILLIGAISKFSNKNSFELLQKLYDQSSDSSMRSAILKSIIWCSNVPMTMIEQALNSSEDEIFEALEYFIVILMNDNDDNSYVSIIPRLLPQILSCAQFKSMRSKILKIVSLSLVHGIVMAYQVAPFLVSMVLSHDQHFESLRVISKMQEKDQKFIASSIIASIDSTMNYYEDKYSVFDIMNVLTEKNKKVVENDVCEFLNESISLQKEHSIVTFIVGQILCADFGKEERTRFLEIAKCSSINSQVFNVVKTIKKGEFDYNSLYICGTILALQNGLEFANISIPQFIPEDPDTLKRFIGSLTKKKN